MSIHGSSIAMLTAAIVLAAPLTTHSQQDHYMRGVTPHEKATAAVVILATGLQQSTEKNSGSRLSIADAREQIELAEQNWARARVKLDQQTFQKMLAPDFYAQLPTARLSREQFIQRISNQPSRTKTQLTRFDNSVLTVEQDGDTWVATIIEKLEYEHQDENGAKTKEYWLSITRDGWKQFTDGWKALFSEVVGLQKWKGERPPIKDW